MSIEIYKYLKRYCLLRCWNF